MVLFCIVHATQSTSVWKMCVFIHCLRRYEFILNNLLLWRKLTIPCNELNFSRFVAASDVCIWDAFFPKRFVEKSCLFLLNWKLEIRLHLLFVWTTLFGLSTMMSFKTIIVFLIMIIIVVTIITKIINKIIRFLFCSCWPSPAPNDPNHEYNNMNDNCYNH